MNTVDFNKIIKFIQQSNVVVHRGVWVLDEYIKFHNRFYKMRLFYKNDTKTVTNFESIELRHIFNSKIIVADEFTQRQANELFRVAVEREKKYHDEWYAKQDAKKRKKVKASKVRFLNFLKRMK